MSRNAFKEARICVYVLALILTVVILFYVVASMFTSVGYSKFRRHLTTSSETIDDNYTFIIDAGHGGEDPGAVIGNVYEKDINLSVALKLNDYLNAFGYETVLTRDTDVLLYKSDEVNYKKSSDLRNRVAIAHNYSNGIFVSIHMNKFPIEACKGLQTFYSDNHSSSERLAELVQTHSRALQKYNNRSIKSGNETIYLLEHIKIPAILIECGFLSNSYELNNLTNKDYQTALAFNIFCAIAEFTECN